MALIEFNDDVAGRHPWEVLNTQRSEVKTPIARSQFMKDPSRAHSPRPNRSINIILTTTNVESTDAFSIPTAVRLQKITGSAKPRIYCCYLETSVGQGVLLPLPSSFVHLTLS